MTYQEAAFEVLARGGGKPLHYTVISAAAVKLGFIDTESPHISTAFSSILSKAVRTGSQSPFSKANPGQFGLSSSFILAGFSRSHECSRRLAALDLAFGHRLGPASQMRIVEKSLYAFRVAMEIRDESNVVFVGQTKEPFRLRPPAGTYSDGLPEADDRFHLTIDLVRAASPLRLKLGSRQTLGVFAQALALYEAAHLEGDGGVATLSAGTDRRRIQLLTA